MSDDQLNLNSNNLPTFQIGSVQEAGDTGHNVFTLLYSGWTGIEPYKALELLTSADNWPLRSNQPEWWHGRPNRCSRDLLTPYLCFVASRKGPITRRYFRAVMSALRTKWYIQANNIKPNYRYDNMDEHMAKATPDVPFEPQTQTADFIGPDLWAIMLRGHWHHQHKNIFSYFLLCLLDLHGLGNAILQYYQQKTDLRNQALKTHFSATYAPTAVSKLAMYIFKLSNPKKAFNIHWQKPGEPRVDLWLSKLF